TGTGTCTCTGGEYPPCLRARAEGHSCVPSAHHLDDAYDDGASGMMRRRCWRNYLVDCEDTQCPGGLSRSYRREFLLRILEIPAVPPAGSPSPQVRSRPCPRREDRCHSA